MPFWGSSGVLWWSFRLSRRLTGYSTKRWWPITYPGHFNWYLWHLQGTVRHSQVYGVLYTFTGSSWVFRGVQGNLNWVFGALKGALLRMIGIILRECGFCYMVFRALQGFWAILEVFGNIKMVFESLQVVPNTFASSIVLSLVLSHEHWAYYFSALRILKISLLWERALSKMGMTKTFKIASGEGLRIAKFDNFPALNNGHGQNIK